MSNAVKIILLATLVKLSYFIFAWGLGEEISLDLLKRNDAFWYERIVENGYDEINTPLDLGWNDAEKFHQSNWGFMPGYPMLIKVVNFIFNNFNISAFIIAFLFSNVTFLLFYKIARHKLNDSNALYATCLLVVLPFNYYFSMFYAESVFLALILGSFLLLKKKIYWGLAITLSYLVIVRASGVLLVFPFFFLAISDGVNSVAHGAKRVLLLKDLKLFLVFLAPVLSFVSYMFFQWYYTNDAFAYSTAQQGGWYREFTLPIFALFNHSSISVQFGSVYAIIAILIAVVFRKRFDWFETGFIWISILLPLIAGTAAGIPRYVTLFYPFVILLTIGLKQFKHKYLLLLPLFTLQLYTFYFWITYHPFSQ